ncbi:DUF3289 family protein [Paenibacillus sp. FSL R7-0204]|uniref:DUF3289 family protein n=1 Tax=Paenibacillus sp. FSL R7-0204 TaxID=2921675 RepID=UPI0030FC3405
MLLPKPLYANIIDSYTPRNNIVFHALAGRIDANGGTTLSSGIASAISLFTAGGRTDVLKYIIMLTDREGSYDTALTKRAADHGIVIYTVGLGSSILTSVLTSMAQGTDSSTQNYVGLIKNYVVQELRNNNGDLSRLKFDPNSSRNIVNNYVNQFPTSPYPVFTEKSNLALSLAIHAFHGHNITVKDFKINGNQFSGKLAFHFYDHFGLDADDEINFPGFMDWFTLQHFKLFNGKYVPFITTIDYELPFSGSVN